MDRFDAVGFDAAGFDEVRVDKVGLDASKPHSVEYFSSPSKSIDLDAAEPNLFLNLV